MEKVTYEKVYVQTVQINEEVVDNKYQVLPDTWNPAVTDVLELIAFLPLKEQVYMMCNLLTISGYEQKEISEAMGVAYKTYRNYMWSVRKQLKERGTHGLRDTEN